METKRQKISRYIADSRAELQFSPIDARFADRVVDQWVDRLRSIPEQFLDECYQMAMDDHATRNPLLAKEIVDHWHVLRQRPGFAQREDTAERLCRFNCSRDGWVIVDASGRPAVLLTTEQRFEARAEYSYAQPCPDHRSRGAIRSSYAAPWCPGEWPRLRTRPGSQKEGERASSVAGWQTIGNVVEAMKLPLKPNDEG